MLKKMTVAVLFYKIIKITESIPITICNLTLSMMSIFKIYKYRKILLKNKLLKNKHHGESCYILVGGMSANNINMNKLKNYDVITANHFFRTPDFKLITPRYHVVTDANFLTNKRNVEDLFESIDTKTTFFLNAKKLKPFEHKNINFIFPLFRLINSNLITDISKPCSNFSTVTLSCIQIAIFLGYKNIYLIGFDLPPGHMPHYYKESDIEKFGEAIQKNKTEEFEYCMLFWQYTNCLHETYKIQSYAKSVGVNIFNLSSTSFVRAFPYLKRIDLLKD